MTRYFCTYFDKNYLIQAATLFRSLDDCCQEFKFFPLCLDKNSHALMQQWAAIDSRVHPIALAALESWETKLLEAKNNRSRIEYYFTLSPVLPLYIMDQFEVDIITYLDADLFFFSSPDCLYQELGESSILITAHRFSDEFKKYETYGLFNVQYQSFRNDDQGRECLTLWRDQCLEWCYDCLEDGKYADQKYLDDWPSLYDRLVISKLKGIGVACWNVHGNQFDKVDGHPVVEGEPLIFYHYHGFKRLAKNWGKTGLGIIHAKINKTGKEILFSGYLAALQSTEVFLKDHFNYSIAHFLSTDTRTRSSWLRTVGSAIKYMDLYYSFPLFFGRR